MRTVKNNQCNLLLLPSHDNLVKIIIFSYILYTLASQVDSAIDVRTKFFMVPVLLCDFPFSVVLFCFATGFQVII